MAALISDLVNFFGLGVAPDSFGTFLVWFISGLMGIELVLFVLDSIFYTVRTVTRGIK